MNRIFILSTTIKPGESPERVLKEFIRSFDEDLSGEDAFVLPEAVENGFDTPIDYILAQYKHEPLFNKLTLAMGHIVRVYKKHFNIDANFNVHYIGHDVWCVTFAYIIM